MEKAELKDAAFENLFRKVALEDDRKAFKELFFEFYPALCIVAARFTDSDETAEDIVQETFFKLWKNRKNIRPDTSFRNFLITAVRNNCVDYLRKRDVADKYAEKQALKANAAASPEEVYTLKELETQIGEALRKLPPNVRQAFEMSRFQGMTYAEIALQMSVSPKTVEAYMSKAIQVLRAELRDYLHLLAIFV